MMRMILITILFTCNGLAMADTRPDADRQLTAQSIIGALDYVAIDYPEAVRNGSIVNAVEYAEQRDFMETVSDLLETLPADAAQEALLSQADALAALVDRRAPAAEIAAGSQQLVADLIDAYDVVTAPPTVPDPASAAGTYAEQCSACHGTSGRGNGLAGRTLDPPPTNFHDDRRAQQRSLYGLYSTITTGVAGTGMPAFSTLTEQQRWALAFYVAGLRDEAATIAQGQRLWEDGAERGSLTTIAELTSSTPATITANQTVSGPLLAYLRHYPEVLVASRTDPVQRTISGLQDMVSAYRDGQPDTAMQLALSAYLEGFELVEAPLRTLDGELVAGVERDMQVLRNMIRNGVPASELAAGAAELEMRLQEASALLGTSGSSAATLLTSAFLILLREGLEAILLLAAMSLYLRRTEHPTAMRYLHFGWLGALLVGALTWVGIKTVFSVSGAQREVVEGGAALLAAFVLLYVGIWLHRHSNAAHWHAFLQERLGKNLSTGTLWGIAALAFIAVYREILETVLFYETLWLQSATATPLVLGAMLAVGALVAAGWLVFRIGARLPLRRFFQANGAFMFALAIVFAGKGVAALQEAGWIAASFVPLPRIGWLGIYPTAQSIGTQLAIIGIALFWMLLQTRRNAGELQHGT